MSVASLQTRFARAVEAEYSRRVAAYQRVRLNPEDAHLRALEEAEELGRQALEELRLRGLFPWVSPDLSEAATTATAEQEQPSCATAPAGGAGARSPSPRGRS